MLDKVSDLAARILEARAELQSIEEQLASLEAAKAEASSSRDEFERWRADYQAAAAERERLTLLVETIERESARAALLDDEAERRALHARQQVANAELARRIVDDLARINSIAVPLLGAVASAAIVDQSINAKLPEGLEPLIPADALARAKPGLPRTEIGRERVWLWTRNDNGAVIGDQGAVRVLGEGKGIVDRSSPLPALRCTPKPFDEVTFHPPEPALRARPLWQLILMDPDGPGVLFDGVEMRQPREVLAALDRAARAQEPRERRIQTEIVPIGSKPAEES